MNDAVLQSIRERNERALANRRSWDDGFADTDDDVRDLLREVDRLREQVATPRAALEPFAVYAKCFGDGWPDSTGTSCLFTQPDGSLAHNPDVNLGHCRCAKEALDQLEARE